jgi:mRNA interferase HigB
MQVIARRTLRRFWVSYPHAEGPIRAWVAIAAKARWANPAEIKRQFGGTVDFVRDNRVIFDLGGNKYRLVVHVSFTFGRLLVKFIGTHAEYDRIDPETVSWQRK